MVDAATPAPTTTTPETAAAPLGPSGVVDQAAKDTLQTPPPATDPAPETKPAFTEAKTEEKPAEGAKPGEEKKEAAKVAPEKYEFKLPEGVKIDEATMTEFSSLAKGLNLPQDEAQKVLEYGAKYAAKWNADATNAIKATQTQWATELKKDPELGGEKLAENLGIAEKGLNAYDKDGKVSKILTDTGLANNVDVVRFFHRIGSTFKPDQIVAPDQSGSVLSVGGPGNLDAAAARLFGTNNKT